MALAPGELKPTDNDTSSAATSESLRPATHAQLAAQSLIEEESSRILHRVSPTDIAQAQRDGIITFVQALVQRCFSQWGEVRLDYHNRPLLHCPFPPEGSAYPSTPRPLPRRSTRTSSARWP